MKPIIVRVRAVDLLTTSAEQKARRSAERLAQKPLPRARDLDREGFVTDKYFAKPQPPQPALDADVVREMNKRNREFYNRAR